MQLLTDKISSVTAVPRSYHLKHPFTFASWSLKELPYALVRVQTESGVVGYGEAPAYWDPTGESQSAVLGFVKLIAPMLEGRNALAIQPITEICDRVARGAYSSRMALETALLDIVGKTYEVPLYVLLGERSTEDDSVLLNGVISLSDDTEQLKHSVQRLVSEGFSLLKIKLQGDPSVDTARAAQVAKFLPAGVRWFGDANQGWPSPKAALVGIRQLLEFEPLLIEQPLIADDLAGLAFLTRELPIDIVADESVLSVKDVLSCLTEGIVDMVNIKLAKIGGPLQGIAASSICNTLRRRFVLGSMIEGSLGMLADYHFALATNPLCCGLAAHWSIDDREEVGLVMDHGRLRLDDLRPGLGYPDSSQFERYFR
jgi:L-Ala-D/L-Glu epimerase